MRPLIPYFDVPILELMDGWIVIDSWATLVCIGFVVGLEIARARGIRMGLDVRDVVDGAVVIVATGFVVGHLVHVLAYNPHQLEEQGVMALVRIWAGFSSFGGFLGAVIGSVLFYNVIRKRSFWKHADAIAFGFPVGWMFGRLGCFSAHDHIGAHSEFWLAVNFPEGARHDLGLYEAMWSAVIAGLFFGLRNRRVKPGFFLALFAVTYAPVRFCLDFLRNDDLSGADVRWASLTPAQYGAILMFVVGAWVAFRLRGDPVADPSPAADEEDAVETDKADEAL